MRRHRLGLAALVIAAAMTLAGAAEARCALGAAGTTQRVAVAGTGRTMLVHVPRGFARTRPAALVFLLHGSTGTGAEMLEQSKLVETADRHGFLIAAPDAGIPAQRGFVWNIPGVPTVSGKIPGPSDADDVAFIGKTIDWLAAQRCADPARVYATGLSGGGRMTSWLGCVAADRFAAIAPVVGLRAGNPSAADPRFPDPATCTPSRPMPVIAFAGGKDTTNPVAGGGAPYWQYPMRAAEARWADLNACRRVVPERQVARNVVQRAFLDCRGGADVVARIKPDAGHVWAVDNEAMWAFFLRHRR